MGEFCFNLTYNSWTPVVFDISSIAANQATVYIKFAMGPTDSSKDSLGGISITLK